MTTAEQYLKDVSTKDPSGEILSFLYVNSGVICNNVLRSIMNEYAELRMQEQLLKQSTLTVEVKNIDCDFEFLRDGLDRIQPSFTLDKDTFIFYNATEELYDKLVKFKEFIFSEGKNNIVVVKTN